MKKPVIGLLRQKDRDGQLETIFNRLGFDVHTYSRCHLLLSSLPENDPSLIIVNKHLSGRDIELLKNYQGGGQCPIRSPLVLCGRQVESFELGDDHLEDPYDIRELNSLLSRYLGVHGRKNLRVALRLPTLVCNKTGTTLAETLSLGTGGALLKSQAMSADNRFEVVIPLFGQHKELEIPCRTVYTTNPNCENDYQYHIAVQFTEQNDKTSKDLEDYICHHLLTADDDNAFPVYSSFSETQSPLPEVAHGVPPRGHAAQGLQLNVGRH